MHKFIRQPLYQAFGRVLVRAPLLPIERFHALGAIPLAEHLDDPRLACALEVASPSLTASLHCADDPERRAAAEKKLLRYLVRASTRPTPFGLFAGVALGELAGRTGLTLSGRSLRIAARPDMEWLLKLVRQLEGDPAIRRRLRLIANPVALVRGGRLYLMERDPAGDGKPGPRVSIRATNAVKAVLALTRDPTPYAEVAARLGEANRRTSPARIEALLDELLDQTVLATELPPPLTADEPVGHVAAVLQRIPAAADLAAKLRAVQAQCAAWSMSAPTAWMSSHRAVVDAIRAIRDERPERCIQVDMAHGLEDPTISRRIGIEAARLGEILVRLSSLPTGLGYLEAYRHRFVERYGQHRLVPLLELLDPGCGLGPPPAYAGDDAWTAPPAAHAAVGRRNSALLALACTALRTHARVVTLDDRVLGELETLGAVGGEPPASLDINIFVSARSAEAIDAGDFKIISGPNIGANAAGKNLGRFAALLGPEATETLRELARSDQPAEPDTIVAELTYLPRDFRTANVAIRPLVRPFEIALGVARSVEPSRIVRLDELAVGVSDERFFLRWVPQGKTVVVATGHMLNYLNAPPICRFLAEVSRDGQAQLQMFDWGAAAGFPFLPRVEHGRIVLSPARWHIDAALRDRELAASTLAAFAERLRAWREQWAVDRHVYLSSSDNRLLLDLDEPSHIAELHDEVRALRPGGDLMLQEVVPAPEETWLDGADGRYVAELVVSLVRAADPTRAARTDRADGRTRPSRPEQSDPGNRLCPPGSEWLYLKLYGPRELEDDVLCGPLHDFLAQSALPGIGSSFFFLRYSDPEPHLRIRFRGEPDLLRQQVLASLCALGQGLIAEGLCARFAFDTYEREIERFGGPQGIDVAEAIFAADSRVAIDLLRTRRSDRDAADPLILGVLGLHRFLTDLGLSKVVLGQWKHRYEPYRRAAGAQYRSMKSELLGLIGESRAPAAGGEQLDRVFDAWREPLGRLGGRLRQLDARGELGVPIDDILASLAHLHCNRFIGTERDKEQSALGLLLRAHEAVARRTRPGSGDTRRNAFR